MQNKSFGFIGSGRVTRIILSAFKNSGKMPQNIIVSDVNPDSLKKLKAKFPEVETVLNGDVKAAGQQVVFIALLPKDVPDVLKEIKNALSPSTILISLASQIQSATISEMLGGFNRIVRMIPSAPSVINKGYNPFYVAKGFNPNEHAKISIMMSTFGKCVEIEEAKLDAYFILTGIGPTFLWFQLFQLEEIAKSFGLTAQETSKAILEMTSGAVKTMYSAGLTKEEVMDLIGTRPLQDDEEIIKDIYKNRLTHFFENLQKD